MTVRWTSRVRAPYGGSIMWRDPITKHDVVGTTFDMLMDRARDQRKANGVPMGLDFESEVEQALCLAYPAECSGYDPSQPRPRNMDMDTVLRGTRVMSSILVELTMSKLGLAESPFVDQSVANERARECQTCVWNQTYKKPCAGLCPELAAAVNLVKGARGTPYDVGLHACQVCGCLAAAHVWVRGDLLNKGLTDEQRKTYGVVNCWKSKI